MGNLENFSIEGVKINIGKRINRRGCPDQRAVEEEHQYEVKINLCLMKDSLIKNNLFNLTMDIHFYLDLRISLKVNLKKHRLNLWVKL